MASLVGVNVDRTISYTFVIGAALAAVAGVMVTMYYGVIDFYIGFVAGIKAFTAAVLGGIGSLPGAMLGGLLIGLIEAFWSAYFTDRVQGRRGLRHPRHRADLPCRPACSAGPKSRRSEGHRTLATVVERAAAAGFLTVAVKESALAAGVAFLLAFPLLGFHLVDMPGGVTVRDALVVDRAIATVGRLRRPLPACRSAVCHIRSAFAKACEDLAAEIARAFPPPTSSASLLVGLRAGRCRSCRSPTATSSTSRSRC